MIISTNKFLLLTLLFIGCALSEDIEKKCGTDENCVDRQIADIIEKFDQEEAVPLFGGLEIVKTAEESPVNLKNDDGLLERIRRYVLNHDVTYRPEESTGRSLYAEARTSKMKKMILPLLLALKLKLIIVLPVILTALTLISIKGVFAGLFALFLSGATALKSLSETKHEPLTAILATPVHSLHHHDLKWGRQDVIPEVQAPVQMPDPYNVPYAGYQNMHMSQ